MSTIKNVIVVGASGNLGPIIVKSLLDASFTVSILTRDASKPLPFPATVRTFQTDYSPSSLAIAFRNQDAVVSAIGALGTLTQIQLIDAAIDNGVKRFIPSDFAPNSPDLSDMERDLPELHMRLKPKTTIVEYLKKKAGENPGFTWSAVGSGPLFDWTLKIGFLGTSLSTHTATIIDSGNVPYYTTTRAQIGRAIASILLKPAETANKYLFITSFITTQNQVVEACEEVTKEKFGLEHVSAEERLKEGKEMLAKGDFRGIGRLWNFWCHGEGRKKGVEEDLANELLELPKEDLEVVIREALDEMKR